MELFEFLQRYWVEVVLGGATTGLTVALKNMVKKRKALEGGTKALLRDRIVQLCLNYEMKGSCPVYVKESAQVMYDEYKNLGGNGTVTKLMDMLQALPNQ